MNIFLFELLFILLAKLPFNLILSVLLFTLAAKIAVQSYPFSIKGRAKSASRDQSNRANITCELSDEFILY